MIGSQWNKWDLHVHSPFVWLENGFGSTTMKEFVEEIVHSNVSVIGLTNYFYFRENELELVRSEIEKQDQKITVLGNIEFRISAPNKDGEWINIHCLFNQQLSTARINEVLSSLKLVNTTKDHLNIFCSEKAFAQANLTVDEAVVDAKVLIQHLKSSLIYGTDFFLAACPNGYGGFRPDQKKGRSRAIAVEIEKECSLMFGRPVDREFFLNSERYSGAIAKPVFFASDAHQLKTTGAGDQMRTGVGSCYTWVKAYPTFEGLRQAIIEPELRVQQADGFTEQQYQKPYFTHLRLGGEPVTNFV
jgi:hypothetical protein